MANFQGKRFNGGRGRDHRSDDRPQMHNAICSKCGASCLIPFKPTGNRPIFCNDCFRLESKNSHTGDIRNRRPSSREERPMYDAICSKCGNRCQIPFPPRSGRDVYCSHCFEENEKGKGNSANTSSNTTQFAALNEKLDKILDLLQTADSNKKAGQVESEITNQNTQVSESAEPIAIKKKVTKKKVKKDVEASL